LTLAALRQMLAFADALERTGDPDDADRAWGLRSRVDALAEQLMRAPALAALAGVHRCP